jgi:hypothetical protein
LLLFLVLAVVSVLQMLRLRRQQRLHSRVGRDAPYQPHGFEPAQAVELWGGARIGYPNASAPLAKLTVDRDYAWLQAPSLRRLVWAGWARPQHEVWIAHQDVVAVQRHQGRVSTGVVFATPDGNLDDVIFWSTDVAAVLDTFSRFDWPVRR